jgi:hypothetical protein
MADMRPLLEQMRDGYLQNGWNTIFVCADGMLNALSSGDAVPALTEAQFSALLLMARGYSKTRVPEHTG